MGKCVFLGLSKGDYGHDFFGCTSKKHPGFNPNQGWLFFGRGGDSCPQSCWNNGDQCPVFQKEMNSPS